MLLGRVAIALASLSLLVGAAEPPDSSAARSRAPTLRIDDPHLFERLAAVSPVSVHRILGDRIDALPGVAAARHDTIASFDALTIVADADRAWVSSLATTLARCVWVRSVAAVASPSLPQLAVRFGSDASAVDLLVDRLQMRLALVAPDGALAESTPGDSVAKWVDELLDRVVPEDPVVSPSSRTPGPCDGPIDAEGEAKGRAYEPPRPRTQVPPVYPLVAREDGIQGRVRLRVLVGRDGVPCRIERVGGPEVLATAAEDAVLRWTFEAARLDGSPVAVWIEVPVDFHF